MATITFDTLKFANTLKEAGVPPAQAEVLEVNLKELVTKEDLKHQVELLRRDMRDMEQRLIIKLGALMVFSIVAALGLSCFSL